MYSSQLSIHHENNDNFTTNDLLKLGRFLLEVGKAHISWHANYEGNFVKSLLIDIIREPFPDYIKDAILSSTIAPTKHKDQSDINNLPICVLLPFKEEKEIIQFENFYNQYIKTWLENKSIDKSKNFTIIRPKERLEKDAHIASKLNGGNCDEGASVCSLIAAECDNKILDAFKLPTFTNKILPLIEVVGYWIEDHCFIIIGRDPRNSDLFDIRSWIKNNRDVVVVEMWPLPGEVFSVSEQFKLSNEVRNPAFKSLLRQLDIDELRLVSTITLGEGHSKEWLKNGKDRYFFIRKKFPQHAYFNPSPHSQLTTYNQTNDIWRDYYKYWKIPVMKPEGVNYSSTHHQKDDKSTDMQIDYSQ